MRGQLPSLHAGIQTRATNASIEGSINGTSAHSNGVATLGMSISEPPQQGEVQATAAQLDELIDALRR